MDRDVGLGGPAGYRSRLSRIAIHRAAAGPAGMWIGGVSGLQDPVEQEIAFHRPWRCGGLGRPAVDRACRRLHPVDGMAGRPAWLQATTEI